ncbi:MAG: hypothetical protein GY737_10415 [Desulfobacteraceae bacterium]|nr:hypothetical protein [Desulfobacteraceae bacterium]
MKKVNLSIEFTEDHPAYQWAKQQSDSVNAMGHIGTHIDCYSKEPTHTDYKVETVVVDCSAGMPSASIFSSLSLNGKALVLYTANLEKNGYGNDQYGKTPTILKDDVLDAILKKNPKFIVIDSYGIGSHGDEHIAFDKRCEKYGCFVIENVNLTGFVADHLTSIELSIDSKLASTGKRCDITGLLTD